MNFNPCINKLDFRFLHGPSKNFTSFDCKYSYITLIFSMNVRQVMLICISEKHPDNNPVKE